MAFFVSILACVFIFIHIKTDDIFFFILGMFLLCFSKVIDCSSRMKEMEARIKELEDRLNH